MAEWFVEGRASDRSAKAAFMIGMILARVNCYCFGSNEQIMGECSLYLEMNDKSRSFWARNRDARNRDARHQCLGTLGRAASALQLASH